MSENYRNEKNTGVSNEEILDEMYDYWEGDDCCSAEDDEIVKEINKAIEEKLSEMTDGCKQYYLENREKYCEQLDVDIDVSDNTYLWIVAEFDPEYHIHNI